MRLLLFASVIFIPVRAIAEWEPPANPDPHVILAEAKADRRAGRYEDALAKHLWFHNHVLEHNQSYFGVRLSAALIAWHDLSKAYPPALEKLKEIRDEATKRALQDSDKVWDAFIDMVAINEQLAEEERTVKVFVQLDKEKPEAAQEVYELAQPALVKAKEYKLCGKYLEPEKDYSKLVEMRRVGLEVAQEKPPSTRAQRYEERKFLGDTATLIALLVLNNRKADAERIAEDAIKVSSHAGRKSVIDTALEGKMPKVDRESPNN